MNSEYLQAVIRQVLVDDLGLILPHEHLFTDLRGPHVPDYAQADPDHVVRVMKPFLQQAEQAGVTALVECSTVGVGRNIPVLQCLAEQTSIHLIAPTGVYRDAYVPKSLKEMSIAELAENWISDIEIGMDGTGIRAGFIKLAVSDDGITPLEARNLQAAVIASQHTGVVIASHTIGGRLFQDEIEILGSKGMDLQRFIWVHANSEKDKRKHLEAARLGVFVEFDAIGADWQSQEELLDFTLALIEAGFSDHILLSHDAGWYQPGSPGGSPEAGIRGFTDLVTEFIPKLHSLGVSENEVEIITQKNPARAFAIFKGA